jgi:hypothetical protein
MRRKPTRLVSVSLLALVVLVAAGCGGSSKKSPPSTSAASTVGTSAAATTEPTATSAAPATTTPATTTPATTTSGIGALASAAHCSQLAGLESAFVSALTGGKSDIQQESAVLQQFAAKTPAAIRPDFEIVAAAFAKIAGALKGTSATAGGTPSASEIAKLEVLASRLNEPQLTKAETAIGQWAAANCHG